MWIYGDSCGRALSLTGCVVLQSWQALGWLAGLLFSKELSRNVPSPCWASLTRLDVWALMRSQQVLTWLQVVTWIQAFLLLYFPFKKKKKRRKKQCLPSDKSSCWKKQASKSLAENCCSEEAKMNHDCGVQQLFLSKGHYTSRSVSCFIGYDSILDK